MDILIKLLNELPLGKKEVLNLIETAPRRYKVYLIAKRTPGKFRTIAHPSKELKLVQRWMVSNVLSGLPVHPAATAYQAGTSILKNAQAHVEHRYLLKLDIKDFFPSIKPADLLRHYEKFIKPLDEFDRRVLSQILFRRNKETKKLELSIGAPSSPLISNSVFFSIDEEIQTYCTPKGITYTRYADDLSFSTDQPHVLTEVQNVVASILQRAEYPRLKLNTEKTIHTSKKHRRQVTGLILTPDKKISIGREKKRTIKALVHRYLQKQLPVEQISNLQGQLAYIHSVEPSFLDSLREKYGANELASLLNPTNKKASDDSH